MQYTSKPYQQHRFINADGAVESPLPDYLDADFLLKSYRTMVMIRTFDQRVVALQRTGQMGTYASCLGQEAIGTGIGLALGKQDVFLPYYRDQATQYLRDVPFQQQLQYWGGDEWGNHFTGTAAQLYRDTPPLESAI